jgi:hypothetical protein
MLVFFPISMHFTAPPEIPPLRLPYCSFGSFHSLSRVEPWDLTTDRLEKPPTDALRPTINSALKIKI